MRLACCQDSNLESSLTDDPLVLRDTDFVTASTSLGLAVDETVNIRCSFSAPQPHGRSLRRCPGWIVRGLPLSHPPRH